MKRKLVDDRVNLDSIGMRIKELRNHLRINQKEMSDQLNISQSALSQIERGSMQPSLKFLSQLVNKYSANYDWLIEGAGPMIDRQQKKDDAGSEYESEMIEYTGLTSEEFKKWSTKAQLFNQFLEEYPDIKKAYVDLSAFMTNAGLLQMLLEKYFDNQLDTVISDIDYVGKKVINKKEVYQKNADFLQALVKYQQLFIPLMDLLEDKLTEFKEKYDFEKMLWFGDDDTQNVN